MPNARKAGATRRELAHAHHLMLALLGALVFLLGVAIPLLAQDAPRIVRDRFEVSVGANFVTTAEFVRPAIWDGRLPAVLLIHGASPADLDFTIARPDGDTTRIFGEIAEALARRGIASLRYHKRGVRGPGDFDMQVFASADLQGLLSDARVLLAALRARPEVDPTQVFAWGWSEGSALVAQLAARREVRGVIAHGPVVTTFHETLGGQFERIGLPYLRRFAASDASVGLSEIALAERGTGGLLARSHATMLLDPFALQRGERRLNTLMDADSSGRIDLEREALATYRRFFADGPNLGMYSSARALPGWRVMADSVQVPVLVLHGTEDANIPVRDARALAAQVRGNPRFTVLIYPGLGHSLGPAADPIADDFRAPSAAPLADAAAWVHSLVSAAGRVSRDR